MLPWIHAEAKAAVVRELEELVRILQDDETELINFHCPEYIRADERSIVRHYDFNLGIRCKHKMEE